MTDSVKSALGEKSKMPSGANHTIAENQITSTPAISRRSALALAGGLALAVAAGDLASAQAQTGITDNDQGPDSDPPGNGRARPIRRWTGIRDNDAGNNADIAGYGRGTMSDGDTGPNSDPTGQGRRTRRYTGRSDNDSGLNADPPGYGRY